MTNDKELRRYLPVGAYVDFDILYSSEADLDPRDGSIVISCDGVTIAYVFRCYTGPNGVVVAARTKDGVVQTNDKGDAIAHTVWRGGVVVSWVDVNR